MEVIILLLLGLVALPASDASAQIVAPRGITAGVADGRYVNVAGDTMTGSLHIASTTITTSSVTLLGAVNVVNGILYTNGALESAGTITTLSGTDQKLVFGSKGAGVVGVDALNDASSAYRIFQVNASSFNVKVGGVQALSVDNSGDVAVAADGFSVGTSTLVVSGGKVGVGSATDYGRLAQQLGINTSANYGGVNLNTWSADSAGHASGIDFNRSKSNTLGTYTKTAADDSLGFIAFRAADGSKFINSAVIAGASDGTTGADDVPGRLTFATTADGAATATERMRITSAGNVGIGTTAPSATLDVVTTTGVEVSTSTTASAFFTIKGGMAKAQINLVDPATAGEVYYCTDCTAVTMCVSTGTAVGSFVKVSDKSAVCD